MTYSTGVGAAKETLALIRELTIVGLVAVVVERPGLVAEWGRVFNEQSKGAGAANTKVNLGIFEMEFDNVAVLEQARKDVAHLSQHAGSGGGAVAQQADAIASKLQAQVQQAKAAILQQDGEMLVENTPAIATGIGTYGVVVSADKGDESSAFEVQQLRKRNISDVAVYDRQGFLRTVTRYRDKSAAENQLPELKRYRSSAYVINLDRWCATAQASGRRIEGAPVLKC